MRRTSVLLAVLVGGLVLPAAAHAQMSQLALHDDMRRLWTDHVAYTRLFIISATGGSADKDATTQRLLQNQADIGNAVGGFYGKAAGDRVTALLRDHILIAADLVGAAKAGDKPKVDELNRKWRQNSTDIATFLNGANPKNWPTTTLQQLLFMHLDQTLAEATHRLEGNHAAELRDYDMIVTHALRMADALSDGIIKQFPQKFSGPPVRAASR